ncbi:MAG: mechanosensitive ion channel family protein [Chlamydiales bacterium]
MNKRNNLIACLFLFFALPIYVQEPDAPFKDIEEKNKEVEKAVEVEPTAEDNAIAERLQRILEATGWFPDVNVYVEEGVVFLNGLADSSENREWAASLANKTEAVVAVVNRIEVVQPNPWDITPAWNSLKELLASFVRKSPYIIFSFILIIITWYLAKITAKIATWSLRSRLKSNLLRNVVGKLFALPILLLGIYFILHIAGLSRLALTVIGGTGLVGLVLGFAFKDIVENFLASILISIHHPFAAEDLIEVAGYLGYVQSVNTRTTLIMSEDGNYVQIPNAIIYKESIINYTANPKTRFDFTVGIGYGDSISQAQQIALSVLESHPAVAKDPEPLVLVDHLGPATVNLKMTYWVDIVKYGRFKVRSALIRLIKKAYDEAGISLPDEAREVVFPSGVPVQLYDMTLKGSEEKKPMLQKSKEEETSANEAEGELTSEASDIQEQVQASSHPEDKTNLLKDN